MLESQTADGCHKYSRLEDWETRLADEETDPLHYSHWPTTATAFMGASTDLDTLIMCN